MLNRYAHLAPAHLWNAVERLTQNRIKTGSERPDAIQRDIETIEK